MTRLESLVELRKKITIPETDYVEVTDDLLRLTYLLEGKEKWILLSSREEVAEWLLTFSFISHYSKDLSGIILYEEQLSVVPCDGEPVQKMVEVPMTWDEFADRVDYDDFFPRSLVVHLAAQHEYNYYVDQSIWGFSAVPTLIRNFLLNDNRA